MSDTIDVTVDKSHLVAIGERPYGGDINVRGRYGTGIPGFKNVIKRLEQVASEKPPVGDPVLDKLGKAVRESTIRNNLYIKVKEPVRIPGL